MTTTTTTTTTTTDPTTATKTPPATTRLRKALAVVPEPLRETALLRLFGLTQIPLLFLASPRVVEVGEARAEIVVPLSRLTKNHLGSMYFGVLAMGADCAGGILAMKLIEQAGGDVSLIFGEFHAKFLKRAEGDVHFVSTDGAVVRELVERAIATGERQTAPVRVTATVPDKSGDEPVAEFTLALSLKKKAKR
jgi:acyl-coenzyme A thioesterase PaaI-like protein